MRLDNTSAHMINRYEDRGSPCLIPLWGLKLGDGVPLPRIEKDTVETHPIMVLISLVGKPIVVRVFSRKHHSILS
jgi:hypothetical protein